MRILFVLLASSCGFAHAVNSAAEAKVRDLLDAYHARAQVLYNMNTRKAWAYSTNITDHNSKEAADAQLEVTRYQAEVYDEAQKYRGAQLSPETSRLLRMAFQAQLEEEDAKAQTIA
ncbi:angiotensin-converting enzyme-like [Penaeus chinensis]|uniref:angiotensin-converting enzyme-like n=1 Tax=Penaeus chinensis TaxID=139456 RepID=UPI001FB6904F|nr:angiotensin-converting enzyme-like [Penaeus chinensis]